MTERELAPSPGTYNRSEPSHETSPQRRAGFVAISLLFFAGLWTLHEFVPSLIWSVVIAIGIWPIFERAAKRWPKHRSNLLPALVVVAILIVFVAPLTFIAIPLARDAHGAAAFVEQVRHFGVPTPPLLGRLPYGAKLMMLWQANLGQPGRIDALSSHVLQGNLVGFGRRIAEEAIHRGVLLGFMLLTLFFLLREVDVVLAQLRIASRRAFGVAGEHVGRQMIRSVQGTVNGLVLVGLAEGAVMTIAYFAVGAPYAALLGVLTALLAMVPFGATLAIGAAAIVLLAVSKVAGAIVVFVLGSIVTFVADHFFRPVLIGNATKLPFVWVLLGILGGVSAFGLLGLFAGPAVLAALILLWREWVGSKEGPLNPELQEAAAANAA